MKPIKGKALVAALAAIVLLAAALAGTALAQPASKLPADSASRTVSVSGAARVTLKPDVAFVTLGTQSRGAEAAATRDANSKLMGQVLAALKAKGVDVEKDVKTTNFSINPIYDDMNKKVTEYQVVNSVQVKVRDLDKLGEILEAATAAGANTADGLYFDVENREDAYNQALVKAIENAKMRAASLAESAGSTLGGVVSVSESGGYNPWPPVFYGRESYDLNAGSVPVSSGSLEVSASVSVTFELK